MRGRSRRAQIRSHNSPYVPGGLRLCYRNDRNQPPRPTPVGCGIAPLPIRPNQRTGCRMHSA